MTTDRKPEKHHYGIALSAIIVILFMPVPALSYLDPTTGSMVISAIVGLFASLVLAIKTYWYRIKAFFQGKPVKSDTDDNIQ
jgi:hypothetical protein